MVGATGTKLAYLDDAQNARLEKIRVNRMLWTGQHRKAFLEEGRTQFNFKKFRANGQIIQPYITFNVLRLISTTLTDLLLGAEPLLRLEGLQGEMDDLVKRSDLHRVFYDAARTASWAAEAMVEIVRWENQVYIRDMRPDEIFPLGQRQPDGQYGSYRRYATAKQGQQSFLLETTYLPGQIRRECWLLDGSSKTTKVELDRWPAAEGSEGLKDQEATGIEWNTIVWVANELDEGVPTSDYDGLVELQDELNAKQTQLAMVIAKHADPKMWAEASLFDEQGNIRSDMEVLPKHVGGESPAGYLTWDAQLAAAKEDRDFTLSALCTAAELSPMLLGLKSDATAESAAKLRLQATKSLARKDRKGTFLRPFIRTALDTAMMMHNQSQRVQIALSGSAVELRDGLPEDEFVRAQTLSLLTGAKPVMSQERGVEIINDDPDTAAEELERLKAAAAAATPSVLFGEPEEAGNSPMDSTDV